MNIKVYVKSLFIIYRYNNMLTTLRIMKNNLKLLEKEEALNNIMIAVILDAKEEEVENWLLARVENDSKIEKF